MWMRFGHRDIKRHKGAVDLLVPFFAHALVFLVSHLFSLELEHYIHTDSCGRERSAQVVRRGISVQ